MRWRQSRGGLVGRVGGLVLLGLFLLTGSAWANGLPLASFPQEAGGAVRPLAAVPVAVVREHLQFDLREKRGRIRAEYRLQNRSDEPIAVLIAFPVPQEALGQNGQQGELSIGLDNQTLAFTPMPEPPPEAQGDTRVWGPWLDPYSGEEYRPTAVGPQKSPAFVMFSVPFAPQEVRTLVVTYRQDPSTDYTRFIEPVLRYDYFLRPARHWQAFGELQVDVWVPRGGALRSSHPLERLEPTHYSRRFSGLPVENLSLYLGTGGSGKLASWWHRRAGRPWLLFGGAVILGVVGGTAASRYRSWSLPITVSRYAGVVVLMGLMPPSGFAPNPGGIVTWLLFLAGMAGAHGLAAWLGRRVGQRLHAAG